MAELSVKRFRIRQEAAGLQLQASDEVLRSMVFTKFSSLDGYPAHYYVEFKSEIYASSMNGKHRTSSA